jgi:succinyl-CoA synthetase alpha subunit
VLAIPDAVDLAIVLVPRDGVQQAVEECLAKGVKGLVVITAGFGEVNEEGHRRELLLREAVRRAGVRMIGPNCMGVSNTDETVRLDATFAPVPARRGSIGFVSQSGALGVAILNRASDLGIGLTQFASMGNKADVSGNDLLEYWENDETTRVICMYLESFGNPRNFTEIAKRVSRKKPILIVKSGRTAEGARAASSHTGALAGADITVSAFLEQCGVLRVNTIEELFDAALVLDRCSLPSGDRVAIVTNAGGPAIMATDACVNLGLRMAELSPATTAALRAFLPPEASVANPVDMIASATDQSYERALRAVLGDDGVDMAIAVNVTPLLQTPFDVLERVGAVAREQKKPVVAVFMATEEFYEQMKDLDDAPPVFRFPEQAARSLAPAAGAASATGIRRRRGACRRASRPPGRRRLPRRGRRLARARAVRHSGGALAAGALAQGGHGGGARTRFSPGPQSDRARPGAQDRTRRRAHRPARRRGIEGRPRRHGRPPRARRPSRRELPHAGDGERRTRGHLRRLDRRALRTAPDVRARRQVRRSLRGRALRRAPAVAGGGERHGARHPRRQAPAWGARRGRRRHGHPGRDPLARGAARHPPPVDSRDRHQPVSRRAGEIAGAGARRPHSGGIRRC